MFLKIKGCEIVYNFIELGNTMKFTTVMQIFPSNLFIYFVAAGSFPGTSDTKCCLILNTFKRIHKVVEVGKKGKVRL